MRTKLHVDAWGVMSGCRCITYVLMTYTLQLQEQPKPGRTLRLP